jgi:hypothetical protein
MSKYLRLCVCNNHAGRGRVATFFSKPIQTGIKLDTATYCVQRDKLLWLCFMKLKKFNFQFLDWDSLCKCFRVSSRLILVHIRAPLALRGSWPAQHMRLVASCRLCWVSAYSSFQWQLERSVVRLHSRLPTTVYSKVPYAALWNAVTSINETALHFHYIAILLYTFKFHGSSVS